MPVEHPQTSAATRLLPVALPQLRGHHRQQLAIQREAWREGAGEVERQQLEHAHAARQWSGGAVFTVSPSEQLLCRQNQQVSKCLLFGDEQRDQTVSGEQLRFSGEDR